MKNVLKRAREGDTKAQLKAALNYIWGTDGFSINTRQARIWFKKAALNGNLEAMFSLGTMQLNGEGGEPKINEGLEWIRKSAQSKKNISIRKQL